MPQGFHRRFMEAAKCREKRMSLMGLRAKRPIALKPGDNAAVLIIGLLPIRALINSCLVSFVKLPTLGNQIPASWLKYW